MKKFIALFLIFLPTIVCAQSIANPDTVCYQTNGSTYTVPSLGVGYNYTWTVSAPGALVSGQGTNAIGVNWSAAAPGLINNAVSVVATNANGCQSTPVNINVFILQVIPTVIPLGPFCDSDPCVPLVGNPNGGTFSGVGVNAGEFCPDAAGVGQSLITYTYSLGGCTFTATTNVSVNPAPVLSPIQHN